ncbi:MAG: hypothetical protein LC799_11600, partial [Actinobacteria bacterium]|nr:hypothetical protein [Actinomycetota bacterium]
ELVGAGGGQSHDGLLAGSTGWGCAGWGCAGWGCCPITVPATGSAPGAVPERIDRSSPAAVAT